MNDFINALKRLYADKKIEIEKVQELLDKGKITQEDFDIITKVEVEA